MALSPTSGSPASEPTQAPRAALSLLASLFFMWGFITVINNTLLPHLRSVFDLNYTQTTLIESVWFIAYFVASIPSAKLIERIGYQRSIVIGLPSARRPACSRTASAAAAGRAAPKAAATRTAFMTELRKAFLPRIDAVSANL